MSMRRALSVVGVVLATTAALLAAPSAGWADGPVGGPAMATRGTVAAPGATPLPVVHAASFVVADLTTGTVLAARDPHGLHYPASTLKTLTALTLLPLLDKHSVYVAKPADSNAEGTRVGIVAGLPYTVDDLFHGLFLASGNDAASALANAAGGWVSTVTRMNATAQTLQADDTHAVNPSGLDAVGQVTSAYDLVLIARAGLARDDFRTYTSTKRYAFPGKAGAPGAPRATYQIQNQNRLLMHGYPGAIGVKTGFTTWAGRTFVAAAERGGHVLVVSLMHVTDASEVAAQRLLDWAFVNEDKPGVGTLADPLPDPSASGVAAGATPTSSVLAAGAGRAALDSGSAAVPGGWPALGAGLVALLAVVLAFVLRRPRRARRHL
jgi:D-alanyl-D-alanine carboxypeptidase (penicillin-binding protein 5/6)